MTIHLDAAPAAQGRRTPPHNLDAERSALGSVFIKPAALDDLSDVQVDDFFLPAHREIIEAMRAVAARRRAVDVIQVADELKTRGMLSRLEGGESYLLALANGVPTAENVRTYARMVKEKATLRRLIAVCSEIQSSAYGDFGELREFMAEAHAKMARVDVGDAADEPTLIWDGLPELLDEILDRAANPASYFVQTGLRSFDQKIGGMRGGQLVVVAARPGKGKSAFLKDVMSHNAVLKVPGLLVSLEMEKKEVQERVISGEARVNGRKVVSGRMEPEEWSRLSASAAKLRNWPLWLYADNVTATRLVALIRRWYRKLPLGPAGEDGILKPQKAIVGVDYLSLIELDEESDNYARALGRVTRALKNLAKELDIPIMLLCQLNRDVEKAGKHEPDLHNLKDSGAIEADASMVIFPWWEGDSPQAGWKDAYLLVAKNRGGPKGRCEVAWWPEFTTFRDRDDSAFTTYDRTGETGRVPYADD